MWMASPITPFVPDFGKLPDTTRVLAADGTELAALSGDNGRRQIVDLNGQLRRADPKDTTTRGALSDQITALQSQLQRLKAASEVATRCSGNAMSAR